MEIPPGLLEKYAKALPHGPRNEREELLLKFLERLNPGRAEKGLKPIPYSRIAKIFKGQSDQEIYKYFRECEKAKSFGSLFWYKQKQKA